jgi:hypothetical protein
VGGELEIQNGMESYLYRGKIATLEFTPVDGHNGALLKAPNRPNIMFQTIDGMLRLIISNPYTGETTVLFPKGGAAPYP